MFCSKCGKEIFNEAVVCPYCGCSTKANTVKPGNGVQYSAAPIVQPEESSGMATAALICAFLIPIVGLILGIVGVTKYKTQSLKNKCIAAIPISIVVWIINGFAIWVFLDEVTGIL